MILQKYFMFLFRALKYFIVSSAIIVFPISLCFAKINSIFFSYAYNLDYLEYLYLYYIRKNEETRDSWNIEKHTCKHTRYVFHSFISSSSLFSYNYSLLYLHGNCSSGLAFINIMKMMYKNNIHSLELPEFGLSFSRTEEIKNINIVDKICDFIYLYITHIIWENNKKTKIILVGHSWAGFFAAHFLYRYPEFIEKLVLINPSGIIEDLSEKTNKITLFMKKYFTYSSFLYLKHLHFDFFCILCVRLFFWKKEHIAKRIFYTYYIILLLSHIENNKSHFLIDSCIEMNKTNKNLYFWCKPTKYLISQMIDAKKKIYFIYGENDDITPMDKIIKLFASKAPFYIIPNAKHAPYADNPEVFCHILSEICII